MSVFAWFLGLTLLFSVFLSPGVQAASTPAYGSDWFGSETWYGDWPNGFAVIQNNVSLPAHSTMDPNKPADLKCVIPKNTVVHIWNVDRSFQWYTYSKIVPLKIVSEVQTTLYDQRGRGILAQIAPGEGIDFLTYESDNFALFRFRGGIFEADLSLLDHVDRPSATSNVARDQWVYVDCANKVSGWILFQDILDDQGEYIKGLASWVLGLKGYGEVRDLTD